MTYITPGTVAGALGLAAVFAGAFGKPVLASYLNDPHTAATVLAVAGGLASLVAGVLPGVKAK